MCWVTWPRIYNLSPLARSLSRKITLSIPKVHNRLHMWFYNSSSSHSHFGLIYHTDFIIAYARVSDHWMLFIRIHVSTNTTFYKKKHQWNRTNPFVAAVTVQHNRCRCTISNDPDFATKNTRNALGRRITQLEPSLWDSSAFSTRSWTCSEHQSSTSLIVMVDCWLGLLKIKLRDVTWLPRPRRGTPLSDPPEQRYLVGGTVSILVK
jgi:hypothetical protein